MNINKEANCIADITVDHRNSRGSALSLWFQGCSIKCPDCHNKQFWEFKKTKYSYVNILNHPSYSKVDNIVLIGGEPLDQAQLIICLILYLLKNKQIWLYTGYNFPKIPDWVKDRVHTIVSGPFIKAAAPGDTHYTGSKNQRIWEKSPITGKWEVVNHKYRKKYLKCLFKQPTLN